MIDRDEAREDEARVQKQARDLHKRNVQTVMATAEGRAVLWEFLRAANHDGTTYRDNAHAMAHAAGWHDAGSWWLDEIRRFCPEREAQMRKEANRAARVASQDEDE